MLHLRPHHGICIANFVGRGYDRAFTINMKQTVMALNAWPHQEILLKSTEDVLCSKCPNCEEQCVTARKVSGLDKAVLNACRIEDGCVMTWQEFRDRVDKSILKAGKFEKICHSCKWFEFCRGVLAGRKE